MTSLNSQNSHIPILYHTNPQQKHHSSVMASNNSKKNSRNSRASDALNLGSSRARTKKNPPKQAPPTSRKPLCRFFALHGNCRYGDNCAFSHDLESGNEAVCPFFLKGTCRYGDACRLSHSLPSTAAGDIMDLTCGICLEVPQKFGLLSGCDHVFCFSCLMEWRKSQTCSEQIKNCPTCRNHSSHVIPSTTFYKSEQGKEEFVDSYKARLGAIPCKHFKSGRLGSCPFGKDCFYQHLSQSGRDIKHLDRSAQEIFAEKERSRQQSDDSSNVETLEAFLRLMHLYGRGHFYYTSDSEYDSDYYDDPYDFDFF